MPSKKTNILFLLTDQQRWDTLSIAGTPVVETPHLDALANQGTWFRQAVCAWPVCGPARASLMTGQFPHGHRLNRNANDKDPNPLRADIATFDEMLSEKGYDCYYWGKRHTGDSHRACYQNDTTEIRKYYGNAMEAQFGVASDLPGTNANWISRQRYVPCEGLEKIMELGEADGKKFSDYRYGKELISPDHTLTAYTVNKTIEALKQAAESDKPFAITCSMIYPHNPWIVAEPWYNKYAPEQFVPPSNFDDDLVGSPYEGHAQSVHQYFPKDFEEGLGRFMSIYQGAVAEIDYHVGRLLASLEALGLDENTVIVFVSDHGEMLGSHGMNGKAVFYDEAIRVPMIIRAPGGTAGQVLDHAVNHVDITATILDYGGASTADALHGKSLRPLLEGRLDDWQKYTVVEHENWGKSQNRKFYGARAIRSDAWKYMVRASGKEGFYNLQEDPSEINNLLNSNITDVEKLQCREMQDALLDWMHETNDLSIPEFEAFFRNDSKVSV